jgi:lipoprotein-anchoring transpeptidase ErfK/SrfK
MKKLVLGLFLGLVALCGLDAVEVSAATSATPTIPIYRLYNSSNFEHLYTKDAGEAANLINTGWGTYEGVAWNSPVKSSKPVYRLYNPQLKDHHYTADKYEVSVLTSQHGWQNEGAIFYSSDDQAVPVMRAYQPILTTGAHNYTTSKNEQSTLVSQHGWQDEGVSWYGSKVSPTSSQDGQLRAAQKAYDALNYTVTYNYADGRANEVMTYHTGNQVSIPSPTRDGWALKGWTDTPGGAIVYKAGDVVTNVAPANGSRTLYAYWYQPSRFELIVDKSDFRVDAIDLETGQTFKTFTVTIGAPGGYETPVGNFTIIRKVANDYMPLAVPPQVPWSSYFTSAGHAFHTAIWRYYGGEWHLGTKASHGCVNMRTEDAKWIFDNCPVGTKVTIRD